MRIGQALFCAVCIELLLGVRLHADQLSFHKEIAVAAMPDGQSVLVAGSTDGQLYKIGINAEPVRVAAAQLPATIVDMRVTHDGRQLVMLHDQPPGVSLISLVDAQTKANTLSLPGRPGRLDITQLSNGQQYVCVSSAWQRCVYVIDVSAANDGGVLRGDQLQLSFMPGPIVALPDGRFCVGDAFGGQLALVSAQPAHVDSETTLDGYHLGGMAIDQANEQLVISHQQLSPAAYTTQDDIHWGMLIKNLVSSVPLSALSTNGTRLSWHTYRLGRVGKGAADPAGLAINGQLRAAAISGSDEVALFDSSSRPPTFMQVGSVPGQVVSLGALHFVCVNRLERTLSVIDASREPAQEIKRIGTPVQPSTAAQRGERAFYSAALSHDGWMSCNSCHIEGHSPDLLVDTQSDGSYGTPKRIPSLHNVAATGPWSWTGAHKSLEEQLTKTLESTMHASSTDVDDLVAFLKQDSFIRPAKAKTSPPVVFQQRCARCHLPDQHFTSTNTFDVGIHDQQGVRQFNPPSLEGVTERKRYMHDARFDSLDQLLRHHPEPASDSEVEELKAYLLTL